MRIKKLLALALAVLLLGALPLPAALAEGGAISLSRAEAARGEEVLLTVSVDLNPGLMYLSLTPVYDARVLEFLGAEASGTGWYVGAKSAIWDGASDSAFTGPVLTLRFRVKEDAPPGQSAVGLEIEAINRSEEEVPFALSEGQITVLAPAPDREPAGNETPGAPDEKPAGNETPGAPDEKPAEEETPGAPDEKPAEKETPGAPDGALGSDPDFSAVLLRVKALFADAFRILREIMNDLARAL